MLDGDGNQLIEAGVKRWLGPVIKAYAEIATCIFLSLDADFFEYIRLHFPQRLADAIREFRHANWAGRAAEIASADDINPELDGLFRHHGRWVLDAHQVLDLVLDGYGDNLF